jgi:hypothetical protein
VTEKKEIWAYLSCKNELPVEIKRMLKQYERITTN